MHASSAHKDLLSTGTDLSALEAFAKRLIDCSSQKATELLDHAATLPGASCIEKFNGLVVRVPDPREPLLGYYLMAPEISRTHLPVVHSTSALYSQSIQERGFAGGLNGQVFFAPLPATRTTESRFRSYAHEATAKNFYRALDALYSEGVKISPFKGEELTTLLLVRMKENSSGGRTFPLVGERIPRELAGRPEFQGQNIEVLVPFSALSHNPNGVLDHEKFTGYEATTERLSQEHIVHISPLYPVFRERHVFSGTFDTLLRQSESIWKFALAEPFAPRYTGYDFVTTRPLSW